MGHRLTVLVALLLAGCAAPEAPGADGEADAQPAAAAGEAPAETVTSAEWQGRTSTAACGPAPGTCVIPAPGEGGWTEFADLGVPGRPTRVQATLTWTPETPFTEEMRVFLFALDADGRPLSAVETRGPSPLAVDLDLAGMDGAGYAFSIHGHHEAGPGVVETSQSFTMAATIRSDAA